MIFLTSTFLIFQRLRRCWNSSQIIQRKEMSQCGFQRQKLSFFLFFLTKKFIERFGEGFSLGVWPNPHERALQRSTSRVVHQTLRVWNQWYYCQYLLEISNGTCSFYALSFCAIYKDTWKNQERGSIAFLFSEKQKQEEKGVTEDEMVAWHHQLNGYEFEQIPGDSKGQGSSKELDTT